METESAHDLSRMSEIANASYASAAQISTQNIDAEDENDMEILNGVLLYTIIRENTASFGDVVHSWIEKYVLNHTRAVTSLIQLILCASNNALIVSEEMYNQSSLPEIYKEITESFNDEEIYPLISQEDADFSSNFYDFTLKLSKFSMHTFINDEEIMDSLLAFFKIACNSNYRPLRHTCTFFALSFATGLLSNAADISMDIFKMSQSASESQSLAISQKDKTTQKKLKVAFDFIFKEVFCVRYRDVCAEIRTFCILTLGQWFKIYPNEMIKDSYTKYIGWLLYDKHAPVRLQCVKALKPLLENEQSVELLSNFLKKFNNRLVEMISDVNDEVCCAILESLTSLIKIKEDFISTEQYQSLTKMAILPARKLSVPASNLILEINGIKFKKNPTDEEIISFIKLIASCVIEYQDLQSLLLVIDSFNKFSTYLTSWEIYVSFLIETEDSDENWEFLIINLLYASVCYFIGGKLPVERPVRKNLAAEISKNQEEERKSFTSSIIAHFGDLFNKYYAEKDKIQILISFIQYFDMNFLLFQVQSKSYVDQIASSLQKIIVRSYENEFLMPCINSLKFLSIKCQEFCNNNDFKNKYVDKIIASVTQPLNTTVRKFIKTKQNEELAVLMQQVSILNLFSQYFDLRQYNISDVLDVLKQSLNFEDPKNFELIANIFKCKTSLLTSAMQNLSSDPSKCASKADQKLLLDSFTDEVMQILEFAIKIFSINEINKIDILTSICSFLVLFSEQNEVEKYLNDPALTSTLKQLERQIFTYMHQTFFTTNQVHTKQDNDCQQALMGVCTLLMSHLFDIGQFKYILRYLASHSHYSEIIKHVLHEIRKFDSEKEVQIMFETLKDGFEECLNDCRQREVPVNRNSVGFTGLKDLSRRFLLSFGINNVKYKNSILLFQKLFIDYFISKSDLKAENQSDYTYIFEIIFPFYLRTEVSDSKVIVNYLERELGDEFARVTSNWYSLNCYLRKQAPDAQNPKRNSILGRGEE